MILLTAARVEEGIGVAATTSGVGVPHIVLHCEILCKSKKKIVCPYLGAVTLLGRKLALNRVIFLS